MARVWVSIVLAGVCAVPGAVAQQKAPHGAAPMAATVVGGSMVRVEAVQTPIFVGMTLEQARAAARVPGTKVEMFSEIEPAGPEGGKVTVQNPKAGTRVLAGRQPLYLTLAAPASVISQVSGWVGSVAGTRAAMWTVPQLKGDEQNAAEQALVRAHLKGRFGGDGKGVVVLQDPAAGAQVAEGSTVTVRLGAVMVVVPSLVGMNVDQAQSVLAKDRLELGTVTQNKGKLITAQTPAAGTSVPVGTRVGLEVGQGQGTRDEGQGQGQGQGQGTGDEGQVQGKATGQPPAVRVYVPNLEGMDGAGAGALIQKIGLVPVGEGNQDGGARVSRQDPAAGSRVSPGARVVFRLTMPEVVVPDLMGHTEETVGTQTEAVGLPKPVATTAEGTDASKPVVVQKQSVAAGSKVPAGTVVVVKLGNPGRPWGLLAAGVVGLGLLGGAWPVGKVVTQRMATARQVQTLAGPAVMFATKIGAGRAGARRNADGQVDRYAGPEAEVEFVLRLVGRPQSGEYVLEREPRVTWKG